MSEFRFDHDRPPGLPTFDRIPVSESLREYSLRDDYEQEHREAEHEHENMQEQSDTDDGIDRAGESRAESDPRPS